MVTIYHGSKAIIKELKNDEIYNHINDFLDGRISREEFWKKALFKHPTNQICFRSRKSIKYLKEAK